MAVLGSSYPTLLDLARRKDENGKIAAIAELLTTSNEILADMQWKQGNLDTGEKTTTRVGLPGVTWRKLNYGVQPTKSITAQVTDSCGMLEAYAEVDKSLADLNGNSAEFRLSEDRAFLEAMNQEMASTLFYGDTSVNPERFVGLAPRFSLTTAGNGGNIILGGSATADVNTSIWLVNWGPQSAYGIVPKGSEAGFTHQDLGEQTLLDAANGKYQGYRSHYKWDCGLTVRDWRGIVRIPNIKGSVLEKTAGGGSGADIVDLMVQAIEKVPPQVMGTPVFYVNATVKSFLRRQLANKSNLRLSLEEAGGKKVLSFDGIPVRRCDAITNVEALVA